MRAKGKRISQTRRLDTIRAELLNADEVSIEKLAHKFDVSSMTVRRDLELLESQGEVMRTHGGAALAKRLTFEFAFRDKQNKNLRRKRLIASAAVRHIKDGQVIMLDTGTTTLQIAEELIGRRDVTIITISLAIVSKVQFAAGIKVVLLGGFLRSDSPDLHGPLTEQNIESFKTDIAFMGADAVDCRGNTYTHDLQVVNLDKAMVANARKVIVVADGTKFGKDAMCRVLTQKDYDLIISDRGIDKRIIKELAKRKINIELA